MSAHGRSLKRSGVFIDLRSLALIRGFVWDRPKRRQVAALQITSRAILTFVAHTMRDNLRQMDFLARAAGDEFLAILPTASKEISHETAPRISSFGEAKAAFAVALPLVWALPPA